MIKLEKELKIMNVTKTFESILNEEQPIEIVLDEVQEIDGAGLQLLMHLYNEPEKYKIINNSDELKDKLKLLGFNPIVESEEK